MLIMSLSGRKSALKMSGHNVGNDCTRGGGLLREILLCLIASLSLVNTMELSASDRKMTICCVQPLSSTMSNTSYVGMVLRKNKSSLLLLLQKLLVVTQNILFPCAASFSLRKVMNIVIMTT